MSDIVIHAEGLGKRYRIGAINRYRTLADRITEVTSALLPRRGSSDNEDTTVWALRDVGLEVKRGEVLGVIGRNGAGKSTLLKILSRITRPTTGWAEVRGRVASLLEVGTGFHPELTGRENVFLNGALLGMGRREISSKFDEIVAFAEIERFIDTPVKRYSSGMYLRLAFAVAAHLEPEILIVDEVLAVGDMPFQRKCLGQMDMVAREGRTVVFVSHNMAAVLRLCTTAVVLKAGGLQMRAGAVEAVAQYERSDGGENRRRVWAATEAPCDSECRLREVVASGGSDPSREVPFSTADPLRVAVTYEVLGKDALVGVTLVVYDERGTCVFSALQARKKGDVEPSAMGTYTVACVIPGGLLNARTYRISILVWGDRFEIRYRADEAVVVSMLDGGNGRSSYLGLFDGVVRPDVSWQDPVCLPRESSRQIL